MEEEGGKEYRWEAGYEKTWEAIQEDKEGLLDYSVQVGNCASVWIFPDPYPLVKLMDPDSDSGHVVCKLLFKI
jgi:hypothetical protein